MFRPPLGVPAMRPGTEPQHGEVWRSIAFLNMVADGEPRGTDGAICVDLREYAAAVVRVGLEMHSYFVAAFGIARLEAMRPMRPIVIHAPERKAG
jgi:hypothetical protein